MGASFKAWQAVAWLALAAALQPAWGQSGTIVQTLGDVTVERQGQRTEAGSGFTLMPGDVIRTGESSKAQLHFQDDSVFAVPSNGALRIEAFTLPRQATGGVGQAVFSLLRGGLRTITGLISKGSQDLYEMRTPLATIGVRGTEYAALLCQERCSEGAGKYPAGLYVKNERGVVMMANRGGKLRLKKGQVGFTPSQDRAPIVVRRSPFDIHALYSEFRITVEFEVIVDPPRIEPEPPASPSTP